MTTATRTKPSTASRKPTLPGPWLHGRIAALLFILTLLTYASVFRYGFINYDDPDYIAKNPAVTAGLTAQGIEWAFTTGHAANWHPVTWLSHMTDVNLFGMNAGMHHVVNVLFHAANTLLLFWFLTRTTQALWPSAFVAALFALHPLHVESVVWLSERKDVLSTFFAILVLHAYVSYTKRPSARSYGIVVVLFALGLMSKPMLVTLPFALLLLDYWPLRRLSLNTPSDFSKLAFEKIPLLICAAASSIVTFIVQQRGGALQGLDNLPFSMRILNPPIAYFSYLRTIVWPAGLAILYPLKPEVSLVWLPAALALVALTVLAIRAGRNRPYIPVGWFWFLGTLVPVIGLVQVGRQATADRYTYLPSIGLFIILAFFAAEFLPSQKMLLASAAAVITLACAALTWRQVQYWRNSETLWQHALEVTGENSYADFMLAGAYADQGSLDRAVPLYTQALRLKSLFPEAHYNLAVALWLQGKVTDAIPHYFEALRIRPQYVDAHNALGVALVHEGKAGEAISHYQEALRLKPEFPEVHSNLADALTKSGKPEEAIHEYQEAMRLNPGLQAAVKPSLAMAHYEAGVALMNAGKTTEATNHFQEALQNNPNLAEAHSLLGSLYLIQGKSDEAIKNLSEAVRLKPELVMAHNNLGTALAGIGRVDEAIAEYSQALRFAPGYTDAQNNLAILQARQRKK
jgi:tetratricopeptide (TPR) repeat protein